MRTVERKRRRQRERKWLKKSLPFGSFVVQQKENAVENDENICLVLDVVGNIFPLQFTSIQRKKNLIFSVFNYFL